MSAMSQLRSFPFLILLFPIAISIVWASNFSTPDQLRNIARYDQICDLSSYKPEEYDFNRIVPRELGVDDDSDTSDSCESEVDLSNDIAPNDDEAVADEDVEKEFDLGTIVLPKHSNVPLNNISNALFFTSAFLAQSDRISPTQLKILGMAQRNIYCNRWFLSRSLFCAFGHPLQYSRAFIDCIPETWQVAKYIAIAMYCSVPNSTTEVRIIENVNGVKHHSDWISITTLETDLERTTKDITICVRPLFGRINVLNLLEFIAYYRANGIDRIVIYHYYYEPAISDESETLNRARTFLDFLRSIPGVELSSFVLPEEIYEGKIHEYGQLVTEHDCMLRHAQSVQFHIDFDEFISTPEGSLRSWIEPYLNSSYKPKYVALIIENVFHCHEANLGFSNYYEFEADVKCGANRSCSIGARNLFYRSINRDSVNRSLLAGNNRRTKGIVWPHGFRSKMVLLEPLLVRNLGVHQIASFDYEAIKLGFVRSKNVEPWDAVLRHYRWCCGPGDGNHPYRPVQINSTMKAIILNQTWSDQLSNRVQLFVLEHFQRFLNLTEPSD